MPPALALQVWRQFLWQPASRLHSPRRQSVGLADERKDKGKGGEKGKRKEESRAALLKSRHRRVAIRFDDPPADVSRDVPPPCTPPPLFVHRLPKRLSKSSHGGNGWVAGAFKGLSSCDPLAALWHRQESIAIKRCLT